MAGGENNADPTEGPGNFSGSVVTYADGLRHAAPCRGKGGPRAGARVHTC